MVRALVCLLVVTACLAGCEVVPRISSPGDQSTKPQRLRYSSILYAKQHQFYLQDANVKQPLSQLWQGKSLSDRVVGNVGGLAVRTVTDKHVSVYLEVSDTPLAGSLDEWQYVADAAVHVQSGQLIIAGGTDYFPDAARINIPGDTYQVRVMGRGMTSHDEPESEEYRVYLWPGEHRRVRVVKPLNP